MEAAGIEPAWVRWSYQDFSALDPFAPANVIGGREIFQKSSSFPRASLLDYAPRRPFTGRSEAF